jgi:hypothetical protein
MHHRTRPIARKVLAALLLGVTALAQAAPTLTPLETKWISGATAVLEYAQAVRLPVDIVVQPQAGPEDVPMAMGYDGGRCKLVLSMRGNPQAEAALVTVPEDLQALLIETMAAHELGHCWRHVQGSWLTLPADLRDDVQLEAGDEGLRTQVMVLRANRREEAFSDLVALAWVRRHHPAQYALVQGWLESVRGDAPAAGFLHDTGAWVRLARDMRAFDVAATPFDDAAALWRKGLPGAQ